MGPEKTSSRPVLLGGDLRVRKPLLLLRDSDKKVKSFCRLCHHRGIRTVFYEGEEVAEARHAAEVHDEADTEAFRQATSMRAKAPGLYDPTVAGDVEAYEWIRANREAIIAGEVFPSGRGSRARTRRRGRAKKR